MAVPCLGAPHTPGIPSNCLYTRWTGKERGERISCIFLGKRVWGGMPTSQETQKKFFVFILLLTARLFFSGCH